MTTATAPPIVSPNCTIDTADNGLTYKISPGASIEELQELAIWGRKELMRAEPLASVILLTPDSRVSGTCYAGLLSGEVPRLRRVQNQNFQFEPGVEIVELDQVKGLEFDYVVLVDCSAASYPKDNESRHLLHIAATRAAHQYDAVVRL